PLPPATPPFPYTTLFRSPVTASLPNLPEDGEAYAVHTDHDAPGVAESVAALLRMDPARVRYVGVMGSLRHVSPHVEALRSMGFGDRKRHTSELQSPDQLV